MTEALFTTRNRSFSQSSIRKRLIRSSSMHESQKQLTKNSTMTSFKPKLQRLIQQGKIQQLLNSDKHSKAKLMYSTHVNDMEKELSESKKSLSSMNLKAKAKQFSINKLKSEIARLEKQRQVIRTNSEAINKIYDSTISSLDLKKQTKQNSEWIERSFIHIKQRLVKDEYFYKVQYEAKQKVYEAQKSRSQFLQKKSIDISHVRKDLTRAIEEAKTITNEETYLKNELIDVINQDRQEKELLNQIKVEKQKKESEINQLTGWVIEKEELNKYLNILYTHRILSQIIRVKNSHLLKKFSEVQSAYLHIKSNTNIVEFQKILKKMEEQDLIYDITVKKVSDLEHQLQVMEESIQKAKREKDNILSQEGKTVRISKDYYQGMEKDQYELLISQKQKAEHRVLQDEILRQRIVDWGTRLGERLKVLKGDEHKIEDILRLGVHKLQASNKIISQL